MSNSTLKSLRAAREAVAKVLSNIDQALAGLESLPLSAAPPKQRVARAKKRGKRSFKHPRVARRNLSNGQAAYWARMTPEERKAEVRRRRHIANG